MLHKANKIGIAKTKKVAAKEEYRKIGKKLQIECKNLISFDFLCCLINEVGK
jgi:hypothetical protein